MTTIFSKIIRGEVPASFVYQDDKVSAFLDVQPINPGHVLVVPNQEVSSLADLDEETGTHLFRIAHRIAKALRQSGLRCEGVDLVLADGKTAGQNIMHLHWHVFPRFKGDGFDWQIGRNRLELTQREELDQTAETIQSVLEKIEWYY